MYDGRKEPIVNNDKLRFKTLLLDEDVSSSQHDVSCDEDLNSERDTASAAGRRLLDIGRTKSNNAKAQHWKTFSRTRNDALLLIVQ